MQIWLFFLSPNNHYGMKRRDGFSARGWNTKYPLSGIYEFARPVYLKKVKKKGGGDRTFTETETESIQRTVLVQQLVRTTLPAVKAYTYRPSIHRTHVSWRVVELLKVVLFLFFPPLCSCKQSG